MGNEQSVETRKNKRLSQGDRNDLYNLAKRKVVETQDTTELDAAYDVAAGTIQKLMLQLYPAKDMEVLARYKAATVDRCIYYSTGGMDYQQFDFRVDDARAPLRPRERGCNSRTPFMVEGADEAAMKAYFAAKKSHKEKIEARNSDFAALINGAKSFNEVAGVWPGAEALRSTIVGHETALAVLSSEVIDRIRADNALAA